MFKLVTVKFLESNVKVFRDELGTKYIKGPFEVDGIVYDYKFIDPKGYEDYCMKEQIMNWEPQISVGSICY